MIARVCACHVFAVLVLTLFGGCVKIRVMGIFLFKKSGYDWRWWFAVNEW